MIEMVNEQESDPIEQYLAGARACGEAALEAIRQGDAGMARMAARQAAQQARIALQLLTGEKQVAPPELNSQDDSQAGETSPNSRAFASG